jgi:hypothetical protein
MPVPSRSAIDVWSGGENQQWSLKPLPDGYYQLVARHSRMALDVAGASLDDGAPIVQWTPHGGENQQWTLEPVSEGSYRTSHANSGKALDVSGP